MAEFRVVHPADPGAQWALGEYFAEIGAAFGFEPGTAFDDAVTTFVPPGGVFLLVFFTFHFGMFHLVHSVFLGLFFPLAPVAAKGAAFPIDVSLYAEVVRRYWLFVPVAALAGKLTATAC